MVSGALNEVRLILILQVTTHFLDWPPQAQLNKNLWVRLRQGPGNGASQDLPFAPVTKCNVRIEFVPMEPYSSLPCLKLEKMGSKCEVLAVCQHPPQPNEH